MWGRDQEEEDRKNENDEMMRGVSLNIVALLMWLFSGPLDQFKFKLYITPLAVLGEHHLFLYRRGKENGQKK